MDLEPADGQGESALSLRQIGRILSDSHDSTERERARNALLPLFWDTWPTKRYAACCLLTTRIYLPYGPHLLEFMSFPIKFARKLRKWDSALNTMLEHGGTHQDASLPAMCNAVNGTLQNMLSDWMAAVRASRSLEGRNKPPPSMDVGADVVEAVGRMGIVEAEKELLSLLFQFNLENNEVRVSALTALSQFPPERLTLLWKMLQEQPLPERQVVIAAVYYMTNPAAVPFLLETLKCQKDDSSPGALEIIARPIVRQLGIIGDPRALNTLIELAREGPDALRATAQAAIRRLMKEAEGQEEVTLLRASSSSATDRTVLLRASTGTAQDTGYDTLLRAAEAEEAQE